MEVLLLDAVREQLKAAVQENDVDVILKFSRLFIPLKKEEEGCRAFTDYWKTTVARCGHEQYQKLSNALESRSGTPGFVDRLSELLRFVAITIEDHQQVHSTPMTLQKYDSSYLGAD